MRLLHESQQHTSPRSRSLRHYVSARFHARTLRTSAHTVETDLRRTDVSRSTHSPLWPHRSASLANYDRPGHRWRYRDLTLTVYSEHWYNTVVMCTHSRGELVISVRQWSAISEWLTTRLHSVVSWSDLSLKEPAQRCVWLTVDMTQLVGVTWDVSLSRTTSTSWLATSPTSLTSPTSRQLVTWSMTAAGRHSWYLALSTWTNTSWPSLGDTRQGRPVTSWTPLPTVYVTSHDRFLHVTMVWPVTGYSPSPHCDQCQIYCSVHSSPSLVFYLLSVKRRRAG